MPEYPNLKFSLIESLYFDPERGLRRLDLHLERLEASANFFAFLVDIHEIREDLLQARTRGPAKIRLQLFQNGRWDITPVPLRDWPLPVSFALSPRPVNSRNIWLRHKTSNRDIYDQALTEQTADEIIFCNEKGELTEGCRTNLFVRLGGTLVTPPVRCGLLPGCLRHHLLNEGLVQTGILYPANLAQAEEIFLGNAVRGLMPAQLIPSDSLHET